MVIATLGQNFDSILKVKIQRSYDTAISLSGKYPIETNANVHQKTSETFDRHKHKDVHTAFICNSPKLEITQTFTNSRMGRGGGAGGWGQSRGACSSGSEPKAARFPAELPPAPTLCQE